VYAGQIEVFEVEEEHDQPTWKGVAYLVSGALCIGIFSTPFIQSVVVVAEQLNVSSALFAFFLAPIASEAPEILEAISLSKKGHSQSINVAFSELIGGTVTKTTLLCGVRTLVCDCACLRLCLCVHVVVFLICVSCQPLLFVGLFLCFSSFVSFFLQILCSYGVLREFVWLTPNYGVSLLLLAMCAFAAGAIGAWFSPLRSKHGVALLCLFVLTGILQVWFNVTPGPEVLETGVATGVKILSGAASSATASVAA
jgi:Sodium/calcium exchanger protein